MKLATLILLAAIAAPAADGTKVYVYWPLKGQYGGRLWLMVNNIDAAKLAPGKFVVLSLSPGSHTLRVGKSEPVTIIIESDARRYFRATWSRRGPILFQIPRQQKITEVDARTAEGELRTGITYLSQRQIRDITTVLPPSADALRK